MLLTNYFLPELKESQEDNRIASHRMMLKSGMIKQVASGIYEWMPLGLRVLRKLEELLRTHMNEANAIELQLSSMQPISLWEQSGRFGKDDELNDEMLKAKDASGNQLVFSPTAEEAITSLLKGSIQSYKQLPKIFYQISRKFRDEIRPRFGVMRSREFLMKDAYSFHVDQISMEETYEKILNTYINFYKDIEIIALPISADPGAMGGAFSHEFHALSDAGESFVHFDSGLLEYLKSNRFFTIKDLTQFYATLNDKGGDHDDIRYKNSKSIEVGHIFSLGKRYSKAMDFCVQNKDGILQNPEMGCYGIGLSRLVGAIIEINQQKECMRWPRKIAPFVCMISNLNIKDVRCVELTSHCINTLSDLKIDFLCDDTKDSPGRKLVRSDTLGFPLQITIGSRNAQNDEIEIALRNTKFQFTDQILQNQRSKVIKIQELSDFLYENNFVIK